MFSGRTTAGVLLVVALATACDDARPEPAPSPSTSAPTGGSTSPEPTESDGTTPSVTPAAGILLTEETSQVNAPDGPWERMDDIVTYSSAVGRSDVGEVIALSDRENFADPVALDRQAAIAVQGLPKDAVADRLDDVLLDGEPAYVVRWTTPADQVIQYDVGTQRAGRVVVVHLDLRKDDPDTAESTVAAVLASFLWH